MSSLNICVQCSQASQAPKHLFLVNANSKDDFKYEKLQLTVQLQLQHTLRPVHLYKIACPFYLVRVKLSQPYKVLLHKQNHGHIHTYTQTHTHIYPNPYTHIESGIENPNTYLIKLFDHAMSCHL